MPKIEPETKNPVADAKNERSEKKIRKGSSVTLYGHF
jgi:hypothetical protein